MWTSFLGWTTVLIVGPLLVAIGFGVLSMSPAEVKIAVWLFAIGYSIPLLKIVAWIAFERSESVAGRTLFVALTCAIFGAAWYLSTALALSKASVDQKPAGNQSNSTNSDRVALLNSINDFISTKDEMELRETFDIPTVTRDAILEAKIQLTPAAATQAERDTVARDMVDGQSVFFFRYVHMDGNNITPLPGKSGVLHLTPKAVQARKQLTSFYSSALTPTDVSSALKDLEKAILDNQEILMDTINESYASNPSTISTAFSCPQRDCMTVNNLSYSRFIQLQPKATAITSTMRKYMESHQ